MVLEFYIRKLYNLNFENHNQKSQKNWNKNKVREKKNQSEISLREHLWVYDTTHRAPMFF